MRAEQDDMPAYLRTKNTSPRRSLAIFGIGSVIACTLMVLFARPVVIDIVQLKNAVRIGGQPIFEQSLQVVTQEPQGKIYRQSESVPSWEQPETTQKEIVSERQTAFDELNYTPKGAVNVVKFKEAPVQMAPQPTPKASMVTIVGDSNAKRDYCWMHKEGSIKKRECKQQVDLSLRNKN